MFKRNILLKCCLFSVIGLMAFTAEAGLITMEVDSTSILSDFDISTTGDELKIDYLVSNATQTSNIDDALYRILIPAGSNQSIYAVHVPDQWVAVVGIDQIEMYTLNGYEAIQCGESKSFSVFAHNPGKDTVEIQAMTSIGDWAVPVTAYVPNGQIPEPATILLMGVGVCWLKRRN